MTVTIQETKNGWTYSQNGKTVRKSKKLYSHTCCFDGRAATFHLSLKGALTQQQNFIKHRLARLVTVEEISAGGAL